MTQFYTCFDDAIDGTPREWDEKWALAAGAQQNVYLGPGCNDFVTVKRRVLRMQGTSVSGDPATYVPGAVAWCRPGSLADFNILFGFALTYDRTTLGGGVIFRFRADGQSLFDRSGYYVRIMSGNGPAPLAQQNKIYLGKTVAGVDVDITSVAKTVNPADVQWVRVVVSGTHIQVRVWDASAATQSEPNTWDIDTNDSSISAAGWIGFDRYWDLAGAGLVDLNFVSVATGADSPVVPLTDTAFAAWLGTSGVTRRYIAELSAYGYDAGGGSSGNYTKEVKAYIADGGYASQPWDSPPSQLYNAWIVKIPTFTRDMGQALSGKASLGFGTLVVSNPADATGVGVRDRWLRMRWRRNYVKVYMGDPTWPKHDFRCIVLGRLQAPRRGQAVDQIEFPINDLSDVLANDINQLVYTGGDYVGQRQPCVYGGDVMDSGALQVEPPLVDSVNLIYQLSRRTLAAWAPNLQNLLFIRVYDNQVPLWKQQQNVSGVTVTATDTLTWNSHGMVNGWFFVPYLDVTSGLSMNFAYYVRNSTANTFQLSTTPNGPIVTGLNTLGGSCAAFGFGYLIDANGDGVADQAVNSTVGSSEKPSFMQLVSKPAGRVTVSGMQDAGGTTQIQVIRQMAKDAGVPVGVINSPLTVYSSRACMYYVGTNKMKAEDAIGAAAKGLFMYYGFSPEGFFEYNLIGLTPGSTKLSLLASDIKEGTMKLLSTKLPVDFSKAQVSLPWWLTGGAFQTGSQQALQGKIALSTADAYGLPAAGQPLDNYPIIADMDQTFAAECYYTDISFVTSILYPLLRKPVGVYQFNTRLASILLHIGQWITVTLPREEWKNWSATDPASPDNAGNVFSVACVVIGIAFDPSVADGFPVTLTVAKQKVGYWHNADVIDGDEMYTNELEEDGVTVVLEEDGVTEVIEENLII